METYGKLIREKVLLKWKIWLPAGMVALYLLAVLIWDSSHAVDALAKNLQDAMKKGDQQQVASLIRTDKPVEPYALKGFIKYYNDNPDLLRNLVSKNAAKNNHFGFVTYHLVLPTVEAQFQSNQQVQYSIEGITVPDHVVLLPADYTVIATMNTPLGPATTEEQVNTTTGKRTITQFSFPNNVVSLYSSDLQDVDATVFVNGTSTKVHFPGGVFGSSVSISPAPNLEGKRIYLEAQMPWGTFRETGAVDDYRKNTVLFGAGSKDNLDLSKKLANIILEYEKQRAEDTVSGNFQPETKYLTSNEPVDYKNQDSQYKLFDLTVIPNLELWKGQIGEKTVFGVRIRGTVHVYQSMFGDNHIPKSYSMQYDPDSHTWKISNAMTLMGNPENKETDIFLKP